MGKAALLMSLEPVLIWEFVLGGQTATRSRAANMRHINQHLHRTRWVFSCGKETTCCPPSSSPPVAASAQPRLLSSELKPEVLPDLPATFPRKQSILLRNLEPSETLNPLIEEI